MAMRKYRVSLLITILSYYCHESLGLKKPNNNTYHRFAPDRFGSFYATSKSLSFCTPSGPVDKERFVFSTVYVLKVSRLEEEYRGFGVVPIGTKVHKFSWEVSILGGGIKTSIYKTETYQPCEHIMFTSLMSFFLKPDRHCFVKQGNYTVHGMNINTLAHTLAGKNFIYETIFSHFEVYSTKGSVFCADNIYETKPLKRVAISNL